MLIRMQSWGSTWSPGNDGGFNRALCTVSFPDLSIHLSASVGIIPSSWCALLAAADSIILDNTLRHIVF